MAGWLDEGLSFLYPAVCQICSEEPAKRAEGYVGARGWQRVRFITEPYCERCGMPFEGNLTTAFECANCREMELEFSSARSAVVAKDAVLEAIHRYKYQRALWFEPFLADLLIRQAKPALAGGNWNWIVPVPLHFTKEREREFNQAERLALRLSAAPAIPLNTRLVQRIEPTRTQTLLSRSERSANVRRAFALRPGASAQAQRIILVDDVFTTGATTSACAKVLRNAGASDVRVWTVARGL
jgi:competence protein ComFC